MSRNRFSDRAGSRLRAAGVAHIMPAYLSEDYDDDDYYLENNEDEFSVDSNACLNFTGSGVSVIGTSEMATINILQSLQITYDDSDDKRIQMTDSGIKLKDAADQLDSIFEITDRLEERIFLSVSSDLVSMADSKGFLPPRLTNTERDQILFPIPGLMIYNTSLNEWQGFDGLSWKRIG
jgi:hypothetical protein